MTLDAFLSHLNSVTRRGNRWSALCPAHADKSPSLSISEGERGILLKCWAGCTLQEICESLGIAQRELFLNTSDTDPQQRKRQALIVRIDRRALAFRFELAGLDLRLRAERIMEAGKNLDIVGLSDDELDRAIALAMQAHADMERAELFASVAETQRARDFEERKTRERQTRAA